MSKCLQWKRPIDKSLITTQAHANITYKLTLCVHIISNHCWHWKPDYIWITSHLYTYHLPLHDCWKDSEQSTSSKNPSDISMAHSMMTEYDHLPKTWHCSFADKQPATCLHCSSQFVNQSVLEIHMQRCPTSEEDKNTGRGRGQGRGRCTGQVGNPENKKIKKF